MQPGHWADLPFTLIPTPAGARSANKEHASLLIAQNMAHIHNCLLRSLNAVYNQACTVSSARDIKDLLLLCKLWHDELEHHHTTEEEVLFPMLEKIVEEASGDKGAMSRNIDQHHLFTPGLAALEKYATETKAEDYDGEKLRKVIASFGGVLQTHLNDEVRTLLSLAPYDHKKLMHAWNTCHQHVLKTCDNLSSPISSQPQLPSLTEQSRPFNCPFC
jgi:hemerythrin-like domain-containing protein